MEIPQPCPASPPGVDVWPNPLALALRAEDVRPAHTDRRQPERPGFASRHHPPPGCTERRVPIPGRPTRDKPAAQSHDDELVGQAGIGFKRPSFEDLAVFESCPSQEIVHQSGLAHTGLAGHDHRLEFPVHRATGGSRAGVGLCSEHDKVGFGKQKRTCLFDQAFYRSS